MTPDTDNLALRSGHRAAGGAAHRPRNTSVLPADAAAVAPAVQNKPARQVCEVCGQIARVQVLEGYVHGQPIMRQVCLRCAAETLPPAAGLDTREPRLRLYVLIGLLGLGLCAVALLGHWLMPAAITAGFGWHKECGLLIGALLVLIGALLGADLVALAGVVVFGGALVAGLFGLTSSPGFGWKKQLLLTAALICVLLAAAGRFGLAAYVRRLVRRRGTCHSPGPPEAGA